MIPCLPRLPTTPHSPPLRAVPGHSSPTADLLVPETAGLLLDTAGKPSWFWKQQATIAGLVIDTAGQDAAGYNYNSWAITRDCTTDQ